MIKKQQAFTLLLLVTLCSATLAAEPATVTTPGAVAPTVAKKTTTTTTDTTYADTVQTDDVQPAVTKDPYEGFNRAMFTFNDKLDKFIMKPIATAYNAIMPRPLNQGIHNFYNNIGT